MKYLPLILLLLTSCASKDPWQVSYIQTGDFHYNSSKLSFQAKDRSAGIDVEMIYLQNTLYTYLYVHHQLIPPVQDNPKIAAITLETCDETFSGLGIRHEGGQKVQLSPELQQVLIHNLKEGKSVTVRLQGFSAELPSEKFTTYFKKLQKSPLYFLNFSLYK